ncbi:dihydrolipoamide dehydrogenase [Carbonactinospora thermoautotrophica]|uniref:Dihydrolipoyl dehydrogenase n=1 Tax=Carbonactinospora thermoautotrophica TaxID=1469144 RepID=A0A132MQS9_9ACTN|nr:dihydrolipoyl dehydrogenase [Carbonactinospora thermoautotrophica]KWX00235.1 dihydrolipoamide dehydrogenase [Carbonactinospora thermoautotrophica]KWX01729.1 Dihydrolipoyl dehydrogenase [Carbonactinospora thermoautotrophica]KWX10361.1 dihydrolipoamide dehydrogenase [Carbonactinospora thermoautotrophica]
MASDADTVFDLVVLGGGSGGYAAALRAAQLGMNVALIEKDKLGGTCLHRGCIPTKALLHAGEVADQARESASFGIKATFEGIDMPAVHAYKDGVVSRLYKGLQGLVASRKITQIEGEGRLVSPTAVQVNGQRVEGRHVLLATGSVPKSLPGLRIDGDRVICSDQALQLDYVPRSVVILGGGVIGVEFASIWRSFGAEVTIIEALPRLVPAEDENSSKLLERAFRRRGVKFEVGARFSGVEYTENGVRVSLENGKQFEADLLLVAVGRAPVSEGLGYEEVGVAMDRGYVKVDGYCQTNVPTISAVGDLIPTPQLAHVGFGEGILVAERLAGLKVTPIDYDGVPRVTYSDPEVASVGLTEAAAKEKYGAENITSFRYNLGGNGKSQILKTAGEVKVIQLKDGPVVGVHMVGARMGELTAEAQLIYNWEALPSEVAQLIHPHPTQSEALGEAHLALAGKPLHVHD